MRKRPGIPWATAIGVKPVMQSHTAETGSVSELALPELALELPPFPGHLIPVRSGPPRPRTSTPPSATGANDAEKKDAPMIAPQLTPTESARDQQRTNRGL